VLTGAGQAETPGVAVDQLNAQRHFQLLQLPGNRRVGGVEPLCRRREALGLDDAPKGAHGR
jgi:hypothetical protein